MQATTPGSAADAGAATTPHPFDQAVALQALGHDLFEGRSHPAWANMIGPYGGITAAQVLSAVLRHPALIGEPVALTVNYAAAVADGAFVLHARPVRTNRSTQHWTVEMRQGDELVATATAMTAARRDTWGGHEVPAPAVPRPQDVARTARRTVEWLQRYDMRFLEGAIPARLQGQDQAESLTRLWVRDDPPRPLDFAALAAMADIFFPRVWLRRAKLGPSGTVTLTVYFHAGGEQLRATGSGYLLAQARGQGFGRGYFDHAGQLWNEGGELLATTHQVVYYRE